jgi:hypothetical protein
LQFNPSSLRLVSHVGTAQRLAVNHGSGRASVTLLSGANVVKHSFSNMTVDVQPVGPGTAKVKLVYFFLTILDLRSTSP